MKKILFYTEAKTYGGHEVTSLFVLNWFLKCGHAVECFYPPENRELSYAITQLAKSYPTLHLHPSAPPLILFHRPHHFFCAKTLNQLVKTFESLCLDFAFVSQGNLGISALGTLAARKASIPCMSYIPMAHSFTKMKSHYGWLRDLFNRYLIHQPNVWLTCTPMQASRLKRMGAKQPIHLLPQPVQNLNSKTDIPAARRALGIPDKVTVIGMCGRLNNKQKGCDILENALIGSSKKSPLREVFILLAGDGEDGLSMLKALEAKGWSGKVSYTGWTRNPEQLLCALDLLILPSHYEGLPHVILEAISLGVPVAATAVDGLDAFLPTEWLFPPSDPKALRLRLEEFMSNQIAYRQPLPELQRRIHRDNHPEVVSKKLENIFKASLG